MNNLRIEGGTALNFDQAYLPISGYKHALVQVICCTILFPEVEFTFDNVPNILDTQVLIEILKTLGANCYFNSPKLKISTENMLPGIIPEELSKKIHGALYLFPALLGRFGYAEVSRCGGCEIGDSSTIGNRPITHMIEVLQKAGCHIEVTNNKIIGYNKPQRRLELNIQDFSDYTDKLSGPKISGATKTAILSSLLVPTDGVICRIENPYLKLDVLEMLRFLALLSYKITVQSDSIIISQRARQLPETLCFSLVSDVSTLMTYICLSVVNNKKLTIKNSTMTEMLLGLKSEIEILQNMGVGLRHFQDILTILPPKKITPVNIEVLSTSIFSDHQPFFALMLAKASGISAINENVWRRRFSYVHELIKLGYQFKQENNQLTILPYKLVTQETTLHARDLRAAATLLIAACEHRGTVYLSGHEHLPRGYENFIDTLKLLGARIYEQVTI